MGRARGPRSTRIAQARATYLAALDAWLDDPHRHDMAAPSYHMLRAAARELVDALRAAGIEPRRDERRFVD